MQPRAVRLVNVHGRGAVQEIIVVGGERAEGANRPGRDRRAQPGPRKARCGGEHRAEAVDKSGSRSRVAPLARHGRRARSYLQAE